MPIRNNERVETKAERDSDKRIRDVYFRNNITGKVYCLRKDDLNFDIKFDKLLGSLDWDLME